MAWIEPLAYLSVVVCGVATSAVCRKQAELMDTYTFGSTLAAKLRYLSLAWIFVAVGFSIMFWSSL